MNTQHNTARCEMLKKTDEELHALHMQALAAEKIDVDYINCITEILAERHPEEYSFDKKGVLNAVLQVIEEDDAKNAAETEQADVFAKARKQRTLRKMIGFAAILAIVVTAAAAIPVRGGSLLSRLACWTSELFSFGAEEIDKAGANEMLVEASEDSTVLHDLLIENGITEQLAPTFFPKGFMVQNIVVEAEEAEHQKFICEFCTPDGKTVAITIRNYGVIDPIVEKDEDTMTVYPSHGVDHYVLPNIENTTVSWTSADYHCTLVYNTDLLSAETLHAIIDSIYSEP